MVQYWTYVSYTQAPNDYLVVCLLRAKKNDRVLGECK